MLEQSDRDDRTRAGPMPTVAAPAARAGAASALPPGTQLGEFEIKGVIGQGGFGIVYQAYDHSLERTIALKEYMPSLLAHRTDNYAVAVTSGRNAEAFNAGMRSFVNEARILAQFDHPSLVKVYRFWQANGTAYMAMPLYRGTTLKEALERATQPPTEAWLKRLLAQLLEALGALHAQCCYHRDIAPDNILLLADDRPVLLDFGAARRVIGDMTQALTVIFKPGYAPVEQYAQTESLTQGPWTDIYALAAVVYFAVTRTAPVPSVARMVSDSLEPLSRRAHGRYSEKFLGAIDCALAVKPPDRPQTVKEFADLLDVRIMVDDRPVDCSQTQVSTRGQPLARPHRTMWPVFAATGLAVAALASGALYLTGTGGRPDTKPPVGGQSTEGGSTSLPTVSAPPVTQNSAGSPTGTAEASDARSHAVQSSGGTPPGQQATRSSEAARTHEPAQATEPAPPPTASSLSNLLDSVYAARNPDVRVTVNTERAQVRIKRDPIRFAVQSSHAGFVYLLQVGTDGSRVYLLFPNRLDGNNRIAAGQMLQLPRKSWEMVAEGPAGTNEFVAIVSEHPRDFSAAGFKRAGPVMQLGVDAAVGHPASIGDARPLYAGRANCPAQQPGCSQAYGAARFSIEEIDPAVTRASPRQKNVTSASTSTSRPAMPSSPGAAGAPDAQSAQQSATAEIDFTRPQASVPAQRCADLLERLSRGDALSGDELSVINSACR